MIGITLRNACMTLCTLLKTDTLIHLMLNSIEIIFK